MALGNFVFKVCLVIWCVLGVSGMNNNETLRQTEILLSLANFPQTFLSAFGNADISPGCRNAMILYAQGIEKFDGWALKMFDAMSKVQSGILAGNLCNLGAYDECQSIRDVAVNSPQDQGVITLISGRYCLATVPFTIPLYWSTCAPDACSADDLNAIMESAHIPMNFTELYCHDPSQDPEFTTGDIVLIVCYGVIFAAMVVSSLYDYYLRYYKKTTCHPILLAFSMVTNGEKLFATREPGTGGDQMECLSGIRSISMMWIILGHTFSNIAIVAVSNVNNILSFMTDGWTMYVRGATVSVDTFFLMGGIVMIYVYLKSTKDSRTFNVFQYYLHRYLRLTPALAAVLAVHLTVLRHFGSGPFWPMMNSYALDNCEKYWWSVLLYIQNYANPYELCVGQSWYLSVDTQLFILSPIFLIPIKRWPRITLAAVFLAAVASISSGFTMAWIYELVDTNNLKKDPDATEAYMRKFYTTTYARAAPWLIGIIIGYFIHKVKIVQKGQFKISKFLNLSLWACSLSVLATCVFTDKAQDDYDRLAMSSYIAFMRPAWSLALSWVIFACVTGYGGYVNTFLSAKIFQVLARLTYSMYLTHFTIILVIDLSTKQPIAFSNIRVLYDFWSVFALVFAISVFWTLAFESPIIIIEKCLLGSGNRKTPEVATKDNNVNTTFGSSSNIVEENVIGGHYRSHDEQTIQNGVYNQSYVHDETAHGTKVQ